MKLVATDLSDFPSQEFKLLGHERSSVVQVSVWLYLNSVQNSDTFEANIYDASSNLIWTQALTGSLIKSYIGSNTYAHGKYNLDTSLNPLILGSGTYSFELKQLTGATLSNFACWCKDWEAPFSPLYEVSADDGTDPFYLRFYAYNNSGD